MQPSARAHIFRALVALGSVPAGLPGQRQLELVQEMSIVADSFKLPNLQSLKISAKGVIAIPVFDEGRIGFFAPTGRLIGWFGRKGEGPGEFRGFSGFSGWKADTFVAIDAANNRITFISPSLKTLRMNPLPTNMKGPSPARDKEFAGFFIPLGVRANNTMLATVSSPEKSEPLPWLPLVPGASAIVSISIDGTFRRITIRKGIVKDPPECTAKVDLGLNSRGEMSTMTFGLPLCPRPTNDVTAQTRASLNLIPDHDARGAGYRITLIDGDTGDTLLNRRYTYTPIPVPNTVKDSIRSAMSGRSGTTPPMKAYYDKMVISRVYPPFAQIVLGQDNTIWLREFAVPGGKQRWQVLDTKGAAIGSVTLPLAARLRVMQREMVWAVIADDDGLETLVRYKIR